MEMKESSVNSIRKQLLVSILWMSCVSLQVELQLPKRKADKLW